MLNIVYLYGILNYISKGDNMVSKIKIKLDILKNVDEIVKFKASDYDFLYDEIRSEQDEHLIAMSVCCKEEARCLEAIESYLPSILDNPDYMAYRKQILKRYYEKEIDTLNNMAYIYVRSSMGCYPRTTKTPYDKRIDALRQALSSL